METMNKDLAQVTKVETVSSDNNLFVEVGGSVVRFPVSNLLKRVADDSSGAAEALEKLSEAIENNPDVVEAILTPISKNSETTEKFDAMNRQLTLQGYYNASGTLTNAGNDLFRNSGLLPLNKREPVIVKNAEVADFYSVIAFFDAEKNFIDGLAGDAVVKDYAINPDDFPEDAVYFAVSSHAPTQTQLTPSYSNGSTSESREGAVADAITGAMAPISRRMDEKDEQFTVVGLANINGGIDAEARAWRTTELIPINHKYPISIDIDLGMGASPIIFYDSNGKLVSCSDSLTGKQSLSISANEIPENATYFRVSSVGGVGSYSNGPTAETREGAIADAILASKKLPLIDEWNEEFGSQGGYQPKTDKYRLLDTDFNSEEAMRIMSYRGLQLGSGLCNHYEAKSLPATVVASEGVTSYAHCFYKSPLLEIIPAFKSYNYITSSNLDAMFDGCERLRIIKPVFYLTNTKTANSCFARCYALEEVHLQHLKISISFADCPNISSASLSEAVTNAANTETITITVHADVYAKLTDTSNTEWNAVLTAAAAKQISFATA